MPAARPGLAFALLALAACGSAPSPEPHRSITGELRAQLDAAHADTLRQLEARRALPDSARARGCADTVHELRLRALTRIALLLELEASRSAPLPPAEACPALRLLDEQLAVLAASGPAPDAPCHELPPRPPLALLEARTRLAAACPAAP